LNKTTNGVRCFWRKPRLNFELMKLLLLVRQTLDSFAK